MKLIIRLNNKKIGTQLVLELAVTAALFTLFYYGNALATINPDNLTQIDYWYYDDDIRAVLKSKLDDSSTYVAPPVLPFENQVLLADVIRDSVSEARNAGTALVPVNFGNSHWAALAIKRTQAGTIKIIYNDSFGIPIEKRANGALLVQVLQRIDPTIQIIDLQVVQQTDGSSCGAFTVENLITIAELDVSNLSDDQLKNILGKVNNASVIRNSHFYILYAGGHIFDIVELRPKAEQTADDLKIQNKKLISNLSNINVLTHGRLIQLDRTNIFIDIASGENTQNHGVWLKNFIGNEQDKGSPSARVLKNSTDSKNNLYGFILGADAMLDTDTTIGIAFSHSQSKTIQKLQGILTNTDTINSKIFSVYGSSYIDKNVSLNGNIVYGTAVTKTKNNNVCSSSSEQKSNLLGSSLLANYKLYSNDFIVFTPKFGVSYMHLNFKGHKDDSIKILEIKQQELCLNTGIVINSFYDIDSFTLVPEISASYNYGVWRSGDKVKITNQLDQTIISQKISDNKGTFKLGGSLTIAADVLELGGGYEHSIQGKSRGHIGYIKLRVNL